jgi:hypothetical protein
MVTPAIDELEEVTKLVVGFELEVEGEDVPEEAPAPGWKIANTIPIRISNNNRMAAGFLYFFIEIFLFCLIIRFYHPKVHYERYIFIILLAFFNNKTITNKNWSEKFRLKSKLNNKVMPISIIFERFKVKSFYYIFGDFVEELDHRIRNP